jgi:hypothetical protein
MTATRLYTVCACEEHDHLALAKALLSSGAHILAANNHGELPIHSKAVSSRGNSEVAKYLLQHFYATTRRLPLHELLEDLSTWIGDPHVDILTVPPLRSAFDEDVLCADDVVEIIEYLRCSQPRRLATTPRRVSTRCFFHDCSISGQSLQSLRQECDSSRRLRSLLACEMPDTSLDTILFLLMNEACSTPMWSTE